MTPIDLIEAHAPHMSDEDEDEILQLMVSGDPADWAVRTCRCGIRIDGFDEYVFHLKDVFRGAT